MGIGQTSVANIVDAGFRTFPAPSEFGWALVCLCLSLHTTDPGPCRHVSHQYLTLAERFDDMKRGYATFSMRHFSSRTLAHVFLHSMHVPGQSQSKISARFQMSTPARFDDAAHHVERGAQR